MNKTLFDTVNFGDLELQNRIVMASMTRQRADPKQGIPNELMATYYGQRSGAGLILTEGAPVCNQGNPNPGAGCIYTKEHAAGWKKIIEEVHYRGSKIFVQLWHGGRVCDPEDTKEDCIAPSALPIKTLKNDRVIEKNTPLEMTQEKIKEVISTFENSAKLAKEAGFDGIEIQCGNGYLIDTFLRSGSNKRTDEYGGSVENRCRFALQIIDAVTKLWPSNRIGVKISPVGRSNYMFDEKPEETYSYFLRQLSERKILYVQACEPGISFAHSDYISGDEQFPEGTAKRLRKYFTGIWIANESILPEEGSKMVKDGLADLISFGKYFINNPDLPARIRQNLSINLDYDYTTFFGGDEKGYTDWPKHEKNKEIDLPHNFTESRATRCCSIF